MFPVSVHLSITAENNQQLSVMARKHKTSQVTPKRSKVRSLFQLLKDADVNTTIPQEDLDGRKKEASNFVLASGQSEAVKNDYGQKLETIFDNSARSTISKTGRPVQDIYNIGLVNPTDDKKEVCLQVLDIWSRYIRPKIRNRCKVSILMGTIMEYVEQEGAVLPPGEEPINTKYFRPDFNSATTQKPVPIGLDGNGDDAIMKEVRLIDEAMTSGGPLQPNKPNSDFVLAMYTNVSFRIFHASLEPIIGGHLPKKPPHITVRRLYTPVLKDKLCIFACIKKAIKRAGCTSFLAKEYARHLSEREKRSGKKILKALREYGLNAPKPKGWDGFRDSLQKHAQSLEEVFNIRLYLLAHDTEADEERNHPKNRLSVLTLYTPQRKEGTLVHILLTAEDDQIDDMYTHAHLIRNTKTTLHGFHCGLCGQQYCRKVRLDGHTCREGPRLLYRGGPRSRQMNVWEKLDEAGMTIDPLQWRAKHAVFWRASIDHMGNLLRITATTNTTVPFREHRKNTPYKAGKVEVWEGKGAFDHFYAWVLHFQSMHKMWWIKKVQPLLPQVRLIAPHLEEAVLSFGQAMPCISMPLDLKCTINHWAKYISEKKGTVQKGIIRAKGQYRAVVTDDNVHFKNWTSYDTPDKHEWCDFFCDEAHDHSFTVRKLVDMVATRQEDLDSMPDNVGGGWIELFRQNISIPHIARHMGYKAAEHAGVAFFLPKGAEEGESIEGLLHANMAGGPSIVYDRIVDGRKVLTFDANSLYAWALSQNLPCGRRMYTWDRENGFKKHGDMQASFGEMAWIDILRKQGHIIQTCDEIPPSRMRVLVKDGISYIPDGINRKQKTVYEFLGNHWHGGEKLEATNTKLQNMRDAGWKVVHIWEDNFNAKYPNATKEMRLKTLPYLVKRWNKHHSLDDILGVEEVRERLLFWKMHGFVEVDMEWDETRPKPQFAALFFKKDGKLHNDYSAKKVLLHTCYVETLMRRGYKLTAVHKVWEFAMAKPFKAFIDRAVEERMKKTPSAATWKLLVNSLYGGTIMDKRAFNVTRTTSSDLKRGAMIMNGAFRDMERADDDRVHIFSSKQAVLMNTPSQVGKAVLDLAKLRMVDFYYDIIEPLGGVLISFDTDAFTFHVDPSVDIVKALPYDLRNKYFDDPDNPESGVKLRGTPGLFHMESKGVAARAVGPKMVCVTDGEKATKVSCKGVKRTALPDNPYDMYDALCHGKRIAVDFPSMRLDKTTGNIVPVQMTRTMKRT